MMQKKQYLFIALAVLLLISMSLALFLLSKQSFKVKLPALPKPTSTPINIAITWNPNTKNKFATKDIPSIESALRGYYAFHNTYYLTIIHIDKDQNWDNIIAEAFDKNKKPLMDIVDHIYVYKKNGIWNETDITKNNFCKVMKAAPSEFANDQEVTFQCTQVKVTITVTPTIISSVSPTQAP